MMSLQNGERSTSTPTSTLVFFVNGKSFNPSHLDKCVNLDAWNVETDKGYFLFSSTQGIIPQC